MSATTLLFTLGKIFGNPTEKAEIAAGEAILKLLATPEAQAVEAAIMQVSNLLHGQAALTPESTPASVAVPSGKWVMTAGGHYEYQPGS